jgi:hypothetical protein
MTYKGTVKNGVVVLPPDVRLPEGAQVDVTPPSVDANDPFLALHKLAKPRDLPDDLAMNLDYYIHGLQHKKQPRQSRWIAGDKSTIDLTNEQAAYEADQLMNLAADTTGLPPDLSTNHDHYLHGLPKP